jgi:hypothetical protein
VDRNGRPGQALIAGADAELALADMITDTERLRLYDADS